MVRIGNREGGPAAEMTIDVPDGWLYKESFSLLAPDGQANVIFSSEPLEMSMTSEEYATIQGGLLEREFPAYRQLSFEPFTLREEGSALLRIFEWVPPEGTAVTQAQLYYVIPGRGYTSTATTPSVRYSELRATLLAALRSISVRAIPVLSAGTE